MVMNSKETKGKRDTRSRSWFVVCPNIEINGVCGLEPDDIKDMTEQQLCEFIVCQWVTETKQAACLYCISKTGMKHLHIVLCGSNPIRFSTVQKFIGNKAHIEMTQGNKGQVEAYINKTGKFEEKGEIIVAKAQEGELLGKQGRRADIDLIREAIEDGKTWQEVRRLDDRFYDNRMTAIIKNMFFDKRAQETPFKRTVNVHWLYGLSGSGKTGIIFELIAKHGEGNVYIVSDYQNPFDGYAGEPIIILDEFRGQLPYSVVLSLLEGYKKEVHCRYANVLGLWTEVYITTIKTPEEVYAKMIDKEETESDPISQLLGRIQDVSYCYRVNREDGTKKDRDGKAAEFFRFTITGETYRALKFDKEKGDKMEQIIEAARLHYEVHYAKTGDTVEAFNIKPKFFIPVIERHLKPGMII